MITACKFGGEFYVLASTLHDLNPIPRSMETGGEQRHWRYVCTSHPNITEMALHELQGD